MQQHHYIYHIVTPAQWAAFADDIHYEAASLHTEGFIHASTKEQVVATMNRYYKGEPLVYLLKIEVERLNEELKYELAPSVNEMFPHIYGPLNKDAVVNVFSVEADEHGHFSITEPI